jgi:hypothetical protein
MFSIMLRKADQMRRYSVSIAKDAGWQLTSELDGEPPSQTRYHDWHRLERALAILRLEVSELTARGWSEVH